MKVKGGRMLRGEGSSSFTWSTRRQADGVEVTVQEAKTQLSRLLRRVEAGESVTIRRGRTPVAMLVRAPVEPGRRRIWGDLEGSIGPEFDEPLDDLDAHR